MATGTDDSVVVHRDEVVSLCLAALDAVGARRRVAELLTDAALFAEDRGKTVVGVAHLLDHVDAMADGRLDGRAVPLIGHPSPAVTTSDARGGIAQTGFDGSFPGLVQAAQEYGLAAFAQQGAFTCGPLGWFTERLADAGLVAVATAVSPAVLAAGAVTDPTTTRPPRAPRVVGRPAPDAGSGVHLAGGRRTAELAVPSDSLTLRADVVAALRRRAGAGSVSAQPSVPPSPQ